MIFLLLTGLMLAVSVDVAVPPAFGTVSIRQVSIVAGLRLRCRPITIRLIRPSRLTASFSLFLCICPVTELSCVVVICHNFAPWSYIGHHYDSRVQPLTNCVGSWRHRCDRP